MIYKWRNVRIGPEIFFSKDRETEFFTGCRGHELIHDIRQVPVPTPVVHRKKNWILWNSVSGQFYNLSTGLMFRHMVTAIDLSHRIVGLTRVLQPGQWRRCQSTLTDVYYNQKVSIQYLIFSLKYPGSIRSLHNLWRETGKMEETGS